MNASGVTNESANGNPGLLETLSIDAPSGDANIQQGKKRKRQKRYEDRAAQVIALDDEKTQPVLHLRQFRLATNTMMAVLMGITEREAGDLLDWLSRPKQGFVAIVPYKSREKNIYTLSKGGSDLLVKTFGFRRGECKYYKEGDGIYIEHEMLRARFYVALHRALKDYDLDYDYIPNYKLTLGPDTPYNGVVRATDGHVKVFPRDLSWGMDIKTQKPVSNDFHIEIDTGLEGTTRVRHFLSLNTAFLADQHASDSKYHHAREFTLWVTPTQTYSETVRGYTTSPHVWFASEEYYAKDLLKDYQNVVSGIWKDGKGQVHQLT